MKKDKAIEAATYILVPLVMWVVSPLLGNFLDSFYFDFPYIFTNSILIIILGAILILCGASLAVWTIFLFKTIGQGTPNPKLPPKVFVVAGPYQFSRNPMAYRALQTLFAGEDFA